MKKNSEQIIEEVKQTNKFVDQLCEEIDRIYCSIRLKKDDNNLKLLDKKISDFSQAERRLHKLERQLSA